MVVEAVYANFDMNVVRRLHPPERTVASIVMI